MHGLGNDFVIVDARGAAFAPRPELIRQICDRHTGVGGDQLLVIEPATAPGSDARMRIYNIDGAESQTCLNATRCVAWLLLREDGRDAVTVETLGGLIKARRAGDMAVTLRLPPPRRDWRDIPLAGPADTDRLDMASGPLRDPGAVSMGNPHLVCFVPDRDAVDVPAFAPALADHPLLPEGANIGVAQIAGPDRIRLVVWERPGILTRACGSGACAAFVVARSRGLIDAASATVEMPGGTLEIAQDDDGTILLTGPVAIAFQGRLPRDMRAA